MVALSSKLEAFSFTTAQLSNGHVTCNQCKLLRIAKRLQRSGGFFQGVFEWNPREQCKTVHTCCEMWEFRNTQVHCCSRYSLYLVKKKDRESKHWQSLRKREGEATERESERKKEIAKDGSRLYHHPTQREQLNYTAAVTSHLQTCYYSCCVNQLEGEANWVCSGMCALGASILIDYIYNEFFMRLSKELKKHSRVHISSSL